MNQEIFVFGSNLAGRHGLGAAKYAYLNYGAKYGEGQGRTGNAFAIPTRDSNIQTLPIEFIAGQVRSFIAYATDHPELTFRLTRVGCGYAGFKDYEMAPLFRGIPDNVIAPKEWKKYLRQTDDRNSTDIPSNRAIGMGSDVPSPQKLGHQEDSALRFWKAPKEDTDIGQPAKKADGITKPNESGDV